VKQVFIELLTIKKKKRERERIEVYQVPAAGHEEQCSSNEDIREIL
tara:strand:- start:896 stop:1033 length:138 start_codon:yes stop_codon:yes gene_type:complete